jgi:hypothetical protein
MEENDASPSPRTPYLLTAMNRFATLFLLLAGLLVAAPAGAQCTTSWATAVSGNWNNAANWTAGLPDGADVACITIGGAAYTVTLDVNAAVSALSLGASAGAQRQTLLVGAGRTLTMTNNSVINSRGTLDWQGGTLSTGAGATLTNNGLLAISGASTKDIGGSTTIRNQASTTFSGTGNLRFLGGGSVFVNAGAGTFDVQSDADFTHFNGGNTFTNDGLFQKSAGTGAAIVSTSGIVFNNNATVNAQAGTIQFDGNGTHGSTFTASAGAVVLFNSGTHTVTGTLTGSPAGAVRLDDGATLTGGTINFGGTGFEWQSGNFGTITNTGLLRLTTSGTKDLNGASTLTNQNLIEMTDTGSLRFLGGASVLVNAPGATFDLLSDAGFTFFNGGNTFTNNGLLRKSGGTGASVVSASTTNLVFNNNATVNAQVGTIRFDGNGTHTNGTFTASVGAVVLFNAGTQTVVGTIQGNPLGAVRMDDGATLVDDGSGATIDFGNTGFEWQSGNFGGSLTNVNLLRLTTPGTKDLNGSSTLTNQSLVQMTDTGVFRLVGGGSAFVNAATGIFDVQSDADFTFFNGGNTFTNNGVLRKSAVDPLNDPNDDTVVSSSTTNLAFNNNGTVDAQAGTIRFDGNGTHTNGTFTAAAGADVFFNAGTHTISGTIQGSSAGAVRMDDGATLAGGTVNFSGTGFEWQGGDFGTLTNGGLLRLTTGDVKDINGSATVTNQGTAELTDTGNLRFIGGGSVFVNAAGATFDLLSDAGLTHFNGGNTFTNNGLLRKSGGTGASVVSTSGLAFNNDGTVNALLGTIQFDGSSTHTNGTFTAAAGASVFFNGGTQTVVGTLTGSPAGAVFMDSGATLVGGTINFSGTGFQWQSGNFGTLTNTGLLRLTTSGLKDLNGSSTLTNQSLVEMTDTGSLRFVGGGSVFVNAAAGTFDLQSDASFSHFNGGNTFTNQGLLRKSGGAGASVVSTSGLAFNNAGTVDALSGTVDFNGPFTNEPGGLVRGTAAVNTAGASVTDNGITGPGTSPGTLSWVGNYAPRAGARLAIELGGLTAGTQHDVLAVSGNATLGGVLKISFVNGFIPVAGNTFTILTANNVAGTFDVVEEPANTSFVVTYNATSVVITAQPTEPVVATLVPVSGPPDGPVVVPATGGQVNYRVTLRNTTGTAQTFQAWVEAVLPGGGVLSPPLVGPQSVTLAPNQTIGPVAFTQQVPGTTAPGVYLLRLRVGTFPDPVIDEDAFVAIKAEAPPRLSGGAAVVAERGGHRAASGRGAEGGLRADGWIAYEVTDGTPILAERAITEAEAAALEATAAARAAAEDADGAAEAAVPGPDAATEPAPEAASPEAAAAGTGLPAEYALHTAHPNPFADRATLRYDLPEASAVRLAVYDALGREVAVLVDREVEAGRHAAAFDGRALAAGVYVVRMTAGRHAFTQRVTLVH